jgi:pimeloyl-ACP methyl ester carboxylesterase
METRFFERAEGTLAYSDYGGDGQLVLMLPGMGALRSEYRILAPRLQEAGYRAVTMDLRGQGESSSGWKTYDVPSVGEDILAMLDHLNAGAAHVMGTSFAAAPAVWAAAERPQRVRSLVLIGAVVRRSKINPIMNALLWLMLNNPWKVRMWTMYYGRLYPSRKPADFQDYIRQLTANLKEPGRFDAAVALGDSSRQPSEERLNRVQAPTLVVMGTKDPDFPDPAAEGRFLARQTGGTLELIEGAGHYPQTEAPDRTVPLVIDFLKRSTTKETKPSEPVAATAVPVA